eukprot:CAMPEP_0197886820 /NCGR_PEP_ID=MMETSP1439-20131203/17876_1 /TAXON_ID=66791 /ORGANISM="Gonyaulax spinifera, Strain CCMP409" /LENGTH=53 /DNA_ID=CAMNT_0043506633 /DNA_START=122 /DNA_END=281 /DNA_ORIENTATION=-
MGSDSANMWAFHGIPDAKLHGVEVQSGRCVQQDCGSGRVVLGAAEMPEMMPEA